MGREVASFSCDFKTAMIIKEMNEESKLATVNDYLEELTHIENHIGWLDASKLHYMDKKARILDKLHQLEVEAF